jgi:hypothetical protein
MGNDVRVQGGFTASRAAKKDATLRESVPDGMYRAGCNFPPPPATSDDFQRIFALQKLRGLV